MTEPVKTTLMIRDFAGQVSNVSPHDLPPGAAVEQVNVQCVQPGELKARSGVRLCVFDS